MAERPYINQELEDLFEVDLVKESDRYSFEDAYREIREERPDGQIFLFSTEPIAHLKLGKEAGGFNTVLSLYHELEEYEPKAYN